MERSMERPDSRYFGAKSDQTLDEGLTKRIAVGEREEYAEKSGQVHPTCVDKWV